MVQIGNKKTSTIKLDSGWMKRLDILATEADLSRQQLMKNMVAVGLDHLKAFKTVGFFKIGLLLRQVDEKRGKVESWKETGETKPVPITLDEETWQLLDRYSEALEISRHRLMKNLLYIGVEELEVLGKIGAFKINDACKRLGKAFNEINDLGVKAFKATHNH